jgi:hypothetical protein
VEQLKKLALMSVCDLAGRRAARRANVRSLKKRRKAAAAQAKIGAKTWRPGGKYTLIRAGVELESEPHELWKIDALKAEHLFHFCSNDPNARRCAMVEGLSKYESVFRVAGMEEGVYVVPIHEHLEQITAGYDLSRADEILESGVPYLPDKRLRRVRDEMQQRAAGSAPKKSRKRKAAKSLKMSHVEMAKRGLLAPVPIDDRIASAVSNSTRSTSRKNGTWDKNQVAVKVLPSFAKLKAMMETLPDAFRDLGPCEPRSAAEVLAEAKEKDEEEDAAKAEKQRRRVARQRKKKEGSTASAPATKRKRKGAPSVVDGMDLGDIRQPEDALPRRPPRLADMTGGVAEYGYYSSSEEEKEGGRSDPAHRSFTSDLAQDDAQGAGFGLDALEQNAEGNMPVVAHSKKVAAASRYLTKMGSEPQKKKKKANPALAQPSSPPAQQQQLSKADQFIERCIMMPDAGNVPAQWKEIMGALDTSEDPRPHLRNTPHYQMLRSFEAM